MKMKNGIGEDITEGKISFPIIYSVSSVRNRKMSVYNLPKEKIILELIKKGIKILFYNTNTLII